MNSLVAFVLVLAFLLRAWGANFGLGFSILHPDEAIYLPYIKQTFPFESTAVFSELAPRGDYPSLFFYFYSHVSWLASKVAALFPQLLPSGYSLDHWMLLWGRVASALLSTFGVYLVIKIAKRILGKRVGVWAGLFAAVTFVDVQMAHYVKHDVMVQVLGLLTVWNLLLLVNTRRGRYFVLATLFSVLAARVKSIGFFLMFPLLAGILPLIPRRSYWKKSTLLLLLAGAVLVVSSFVVLVFCGKGFTFDWVGLQNLSRRYWRLLFGPFLEGTHVAYSNLDGIPNCLWWPLYLSTSGLFLPQFVASVGGLFIFLKKKLPAKYLILSLVIPYYLVLSLQRFHADRWIILITPYLAIFAAFFVEALLNLVRKIKVRRLSTHLLVFLVGFLFLGISLFRSAAFSYLVSQKDTRHRAWEWFRENYPTDEPLFVIGAANVIGDALKGEGYYSIINLFPLHTREIFQYPEDLMIICSGTYRSVENYRNIEPNQTIWENYQLIKEKGELVKEFSQPLFRDFVFSPDFLENSASVNSYHNPVVQIYRLPEIPEYAFEVMPDFTEFPRCMESDLELLEEGPGGILYASGRGAAVVGGPRKILKGGEYVLDYSVRVSRCDSPKDTLVLRATAFEWEPEFARQVYECGEVVSSDGLGLNLHLAKTSPVKFVLEIPKGIELKIEKSVLRQIVSGAESPLSN